MKNKQIISSKFSSGFALPTVIIVVTAMLLLAIGILSISGVERITTHTTTDIQRADFAARAAVEDLRGLIHKEATNDDFLIIQSLPIVPIIEGIHTAPQLFLVRGKPSSTSFSYKYIPLFSTTMVVQDDMKCKPPILEDLAEKNPNDMIEFMTIPYYGKVKVSWLPIHDDQGKMVSRYAYWIEDLQSRLDPAKIGNEKGESGCHMREIWPFPAPGLNPAAESKSEPMLDQIPLYAVDPKATSTDQGKLAGTLVKNRSLQISPESLLAAAGFIAPIIRVNDVSDGILGELVDEKAKAVEKALVTELCAYKEQPLLPYSDGIDPDSAGTPKLNLNKLLATGGSSAVDEMAAFIAKALPHFEERKGGFPNDYLKTLAANALDYADEDSDSTTDEKDYRGVDSYPLVSEFLMRFRLESVTKIGANTFVEIIATTYVELWNMTNHSVSGNAEFTHDTKYKCSDNNVIDLSNMSVAKPNLIKQDGSYWFPSRSITLNPSQYLLINCGEVRYRFSIGTNKLKQDTVRLKGEINGTSGAGYKLKWNGKIVDQARSGIDRKHCNITFFTGYSLLKYRQQVRATVPGHSYFIKNPTYTPSDYRRNMGDPRMSFYYSLPQAANEYPNHYSPNCRNIRWQKGSSSSVLNGYALDIPTKTKVYERVLPSEWPDGGHNSICESSVPLNQPHAIEINPDNPIFFPPANSALLSPPKEEAVMRISNLGKFYSVTELGRVYDPIMWKVAEPVGANLPWGDVLATTKASSEFGGGNTLRIGRPEHPKFISEDTPGLEAFRLLDLFHVGLSRSNSAEKIQGRLIQIQGHVNINTASREAIRTIVIGQLTMDPKMAICSSENHETAALMAPPVVPFTMTDEMLSTEADFLADSIIEHRKTKFFTSPSELAEVRDSDENLVFGNKDLIADGKKVQRTDSAAEEIFARIYEASTVRSRNFRIWVVGQSLAPADSKKSSMAVLSESRKVFTVFADPGVRDDDGKIVSEKSRLIILHENNF